MPRRNKLEKFGEILTFENVYENFDIRDDILVHKDGVNVQMSGKWNSDHFAVDQPITLELACGRGEYANALAKVYPQRNFIGVDIKGARIWKGAKIALQDNLSNVCYLRTRIEKIENFFSQNEVDEIWITFPDPFLRESKENRRLTSPPFLDRYRNILKENGIIHLKTDSPELYAFTKEVLEADTACRILYDNDDIYSKPLEFPELEIKTYYERLHLKNQKKITYLRFTI